MFYRDVLIECTYTYLGELEVAKKGQRKGVTLNDRYIHRKKGYKRLDYQE